MAKIGYYYRLFSFLNFPRAPILDFMTLCGCCYCQFAEAPWNPRWRCAGNVKAKIGDNQRLVCPTWKYHFRAFQQNLK